MQEDESTTERPPRHTRGNPHPPAFLNWPAAHTSPRIELYARPYPLAPASRRETQPKRPPHLTCSRRGELLTRTIHS